MKKILIITGFLLIWHPSAQAADWAVFLNAFGETATAYLNDSFLLLGTTADGYVADIVKEQTARDIVTNVQKRVRVVRAKLKAVSQCRIAEVDKRLIDLLDGAYACMDIQAHALLQYIKEKSPDAARRFDEQRGKCLENIDEISKFYDKLPPPPELAEPLSTR
ncbi:hypothetical protein ACFL2Q_06695 [Thermodesulfobacteriota bacterium]